MTRSTRKGAGGFGDGVAVTALHGCRPLGKSVRWQTFSPSRSAPAGVGRAGRRLEALFTGGLARSLNQRGQCSSEARGWGPVAASRYSRLTWVALGPAALGSVGGDDHFEGTDERSSHRRCLVLVNEARDDAG